MKTPNNNQKMPGKPQQTEISSNNNDTVYYEACEDSVEIEKMQHSDYEYDSDAI